MSMIPAQLARLESQYRRGELSHREFDRARQHLLSVPRDDNPALPGTTGVAPVSFILLGALVGTTVIAALLFG